MKKVFKNVVGRFIKKKTEEWKGEMMYEYFIGALIFGVPWLFLFIRRKDLRWPMLWTSIVYIAFSGVIVAVWSLLSKLIYLGEPIVPSYWYPPTFFNLGTLTGFAGIEDILWLFFIGGIATCIYEYLSNSRIVVRRSYKIHGVAFAAAFVSFFIFHYFFPVNLIYGFIFSNICGALVLCIERRDLIRHALLGGVAFLIVYVMAFLFVLIVFPDMVNNFYNIENLSGIKILYIPIEEYLYAISFGLLWGPMYEYAHGWRCGYQR
ncbi:MAG TPA: lycopene cyclase domain-containing protein [Candidatus Nanoarchaeia archaeon]|nr:lycopene cyclase domain-containing protein [Candidatus Nanoarchaeia archaeon]